MTIQEKTKTSPELLKEILVYIKEKEIATIANISMVTGRNPQEIEDAVSLLFNKGYVRNISSPYLGQPRYMGLTPDGLKAITEIKEYQEPKRKFE